MTQELTTVDAVIDELGGPTAASRIRALGVTPQAVSNWKLRQRLPAEKYLVVSAELRQRGFSAPASLFGIHGETTT